MATDIYSSPDFKRSRSAYRAQCAFEYLIAILVSDAFLAKLLSELGLSDTLIGIISSLIAAAFLFQLAAILFVQKVRNVKRIVILFSTLSQIVFTSLYFIPFLPVSHEIRTVLVIICILIAYFGNYLINSMLFKWANSFVDPAKRGDYSAGKEMISLIAGMIFTLVVGQIIDRAESLDNIRAGFIFIAVAGLILTVCNFISLMMIIKEPTTESVNEVSITKVIGELIGNKNFIRIIVFTILWNVSQYMTVGFLGIYKTKDLLLSVGTVQIINIVGNIFRFFLSKPIGRYSDKYSYSRGIELALCIAAGGFAFNIFSSPSTKWCIVAYTILHSVSIAGINQNSNNILYSYVPNKYYVYAAAIKNSLGGIFGFAASLLGSRILGLVQNNGNNVFGLHIYGQQILSGISMLLIVAAALYVHFVIDNKTLMKQ